MRRINPPRPPFYSIPPPLALFFTSVLARWEPPYTGGVPAYISYRLAMLLHQIYGLLISGRETASSAADWLNLRPGGKIHQSSGPQPEPGAVAEPQGETRERQAKGEEQPYSGHVLRWHTCEHPWTVLEKSLILFSTCTVVNTFSEPQKQSSSLVTTMYRSTKGASKARRDQINAEIRNLKDLLPISDADKSRLSYLHIMSLACMYTRKSVFFSQGKYNL